MGKVSFHFLAIVFNFCIAYIILINFVGWSGAYRDIVGFNNSTNWTNSYFGFQSLQNMISWIGNGFNSERVYGLSFDQFLDTIEDTLSIITFKFPKILSYISSNTAFTIVDIVDIIVKVLFQPAALIINIFKLFAFIVYYFFVILTALFRAFSGAFNIPFENIPDYTPSAIVPVLV